MVVFDAQLVVVAVTIGVDAVDNDIELVLAVINGKLLIVGN